MSKKSDAMVSSRDLAPVLKLEHQAFVTLLAKRQAIPSGRLPSPDRYDAPTYISLEDLVGITAALSLTPAQAAGLCATWRERARPRSTALAAEARERDAIGVIGLLFKSPSPLATFIEMVRDGAPAKLAASKGIRIECDDIWIAPSAQYLALHIRAVGLTTQALANALIALPGAYRTGPKKFAGQQCRGIGVKLDLFLKMIKES